MKSVLAIFLFWTVSVHSQQRIPQEMLPVQEIGKGSIKNPYWTEPQWKIWSIDSSPVKIESGELKGEFEVLEESKRLYPALIEAGGKFQFKMVNEKGLSSGIWDDVYLSKDNFHTRLNTHKGQFLLAGKTRGFEKFTERFKLGVNFTSQSYARRGRHIVDDFVSVLDVERHFFFANTVRCSPAHISFRDNKKEAVEDTYDALYAHSYQSIGQSGSEMHAIYKMMYAGGFIPRKVKDTLKKHGLYAPAMLTIFKASLPYTYSSGKALPFENEMRHKVAYSSHGTPQHPHYCSANPHFHAYDDNLHLANMVKMAEAMKTTPPVTVLGLGGLAVLKNGQQIKDKKLIQQHIKMMTPTNLGIWAKPEETIVVRVNLNKSFDLNDEKLSFVCQRVYPNQKNVSIKQAAHGIFDIQVSHDPKLPKGRIPIICTSENESGLKGNPVFINLYWPDEGELADYHHFAEIEKRLQPEYKKRGISKKPVTVNKRPLTAFGILGNTVIGTPGERIEIPLNISDPEGHEIIVYRRSGEVGQIEDGKYIFEIPKEAYKPLYKVHLHISDGTGGYTGKLIQIAVTQEKNKVNDNWLVSSFQSSKVSQGMQVGTVTQSGNKFSITEQKVPDSAFQALFISQRQEKPFDLTLKSDEIEKFGLQFSSGLDHYSSQSRLFFSKGIFQHYIRKDEAPWGIRTYKSVHNQKTSKIKFLRMVSDGKSVASYLSEDGESWRQISGQNLPLSDFYAGILSYGNGNSSCELVDQKTAIPLIVSKEKIERNGTYKKLTLTIKSIDKECEIRYTTDGTEPVLDSTLYDKEILISKPGKHQINTILIKAGKIFGKTSASYEIKK